MIHKGYAGWREDVAQDIRPCRRHRLGQIVNSRAERRASVCKVCISSLNLILRIHKPAHQHQTRYFTLEETKLGSEDNSTLVALTIMHILCLHGMGTNSQVSHKSGYFTFMAKQMDPVLKLLIGFSRCRQISLFLDSPYHCCNQRRNREHKSWSRSAILRNCNL